MTMKSVINKQRLTNYLKGIQKSIDLFQSQGYNEVYFTAQFIRGGKKQNGIDRGDITSFAKQIRTYVSSEEADSVKIEFFDENTSKSIYSKMLTDLCSSDTNTEQQKQPSEGLGGFNGLGEAAVNAIVDKKVIEIRKEDKFQQMTEELKELREKTSTLQQQKDELEETLKVKKDFEYYAALIGAAFPGLAPLFSGTPLAQAAGFLAGTGEAKESAMLSESGGASGESQSISAMLCEFCSSLNTQEVSSVHLLFMSFEKDKSLIQKALHFITTQSPVNN